MCESRGGRPGSPSLISPTIAVGVSSSEREDNTELWSCVRVEVAVLRSPSLISPTLSVGVSNIQPTPNAPRLSLNYTMMTMWSSMSSDVGLTGHVRDKL